MKSKQITTEDKFNNKWGFVISCIGSSVGMANIWLFPYRAGEFGGAAFLIPYIIFVVLIGFTGVIGEMAFGRAMQSGPLGAFKKAYEMKGSKLGTFIGLIPVIGSLGIAIGYSVIIGWILKFFADSITGKIISEEDPSAIFGELSRDFGSIPWHLLGLFLVLLCMSFGVARGIEKVNRIMMPAFFIPCSPRCFPRRFSARVFVLIQTRLVGNGQSPHVGIRDGAGIFLPFPCRKRNCCLRKLLKI
jgi:NSS family neurotransmitter:Na+ symporter